MKNIWELIRRDEFEKACEEVDLEYEQTGITTNFGNKLTALLHLKRYNEVIEFANRMITLKKNANPTLNLSSSSEYIQMGMASWFLNKKAQAIKFWQDGEKCLYQDASGGVSLFAIEYFAAVKMKDEGLKKSAIRGIKKKLRNKQAINWPGPIGHYLLNEISAAELLSYVSTTPILHERHLCQANFAMAIKELEKGNFSGYKEKLKECIQDGSLAYLEDMFYLAKGELEMLDKKNE